MLEVFSLPTRSTGQPSYCLLRKAHLEPKETLPRSPDLSLLSRGSWCRVSCEQSACCYRNCEDSAAETTHLELTLWRGGGREAGEVTESHPNSSVELQLTIVCRQGTSTHSAVNLQEYTFADVLSLMLLKFPNACCCLACLKYHSIMGVPTFLPGLVTQIPSRKLYLD